MHWDVYFPYIITCTPNSKKNTSCKYEYIRIISITHFTNKHDIYMYIPYTNCTIFLRVLSRVLYVITSFQFYSCYSVCFCYINSMYFALCTFIRLFESSVIYFYYSLTPKPCLLFRSAFRATTTTTTKCTRAR